MKIFIAVMLFCSTIARAAVINAGSASVAGFNSAVAMAVEGDTVILPDNHLNPDIWTIAANTISGKGITIQGAPGTNTIIIDELATRTSLIAASYSKTNGGTFRITGIHFKHGVTNTVENNQGLLYLIGSDNGTQDSNIQVDHCWFDKCAGRPFTLHCWKALVNQNTVDFGGYSGIFIKPDINNGDYGDNSWATASTPGGANMVYFESNFFTNTISRACIDAYTGARYVFRFNTAYNCGPQNHGTESTQRARGGRWIEVYGNTFIGNASSGEYAILYRSGSGIVASNSVTGTTFPGLMRMENHRMITGYPPWGGAFGQNVWDHNDPTLYQSGAHTGAANVQVLVDSTKAWAVNQWVGYSIRNTATGLGGQVQSSTANTVTCRAPDQPFGQVLWSPGQAYQILKIIKVLDAPGAGTGTLLVGGSDSVAPTPTTWPTEADEPIYYWANTGTTTVSPSSYYCIIAGRDYTNAVLSGYSPLAFPNPLLTGCQ